MDPRSTVEAMLRPDLRGRTAYGAPQLDVAVALNTNENSYAVPPVVVAAITEAVAERRRRAQPLPRPGVHRPARGPGGLPVPQRDARRGRRRSGRATAPTRCSCTCSRRSAGPGAPRSASRRPTRCTRSSRRRPARRGSTGCAACAGGGSVRPRRGIRRRAGAPAPARRRLPLLAEQPDRHGARRSTSSRRSTTRRRGRARRRRRGVRRVRPPRHAERADPARGPAAARRDPHDEQGVRARRRPRSATSRPTRRSSTRCGWCGCRTTCPPRPRRSRSPRSRTRTSCSRRSAPSRTSATGSSPASPGLGLDPVPSDANFVLFGGLADAHATWSALLERGVLVRDVGIAHYLRVTAGTPQETTRFLEAVTDLAPTHRTGALREQRRSPPHRHRAPGARPRAPSR